MPALRSPRIGLLSAVLSLSLVAAGAWAANPLPRFTEEREAAALHFVKKYSHELIPILEELKKSHLTQYQTEIREIFQVTEMLAELDDQHRHDLELKVWKTENKAFVLMAKMANAKDEERKTYEKQLEDIAHELIDLEVQCLEATAESLEKELGETKNTITRLRENMEQSVKERTQALLEKAKSRKKL
jgi:hypothetical protein